MNVWRGYHRRSMKPSRTCLAVESPVTLVIEVKNVRLAMDCQTISGCPMFVHMCNELHDAHNECTEAFLHRTTLDQRM